MSTVRHMARFGYPTKRDTWAAVRFAGQVLDREVCYLVGSSHHFCLGDGSTISLTPDSGQRFRVERWRDGHVSDTLYAFVGNSSRLADVLLGLTAGVEAAA